MPLPDISLIMTRPKAGNARFIKQLPNSTRQMLNIIESPLIEIAPTSTQFVIGKQDAVIFTSRNGVDIAPDGQGRRAFCVGEKTTSVAHSRGWRAIFAGETAEALVAFISAYPKLSQVWHLAGRHTRGQIAERLTASGRNVQRMVLYDQVLTPLTEQASAALDGPDPVIVMLFSPRTAAQFAQVCQKNVQAHVIALSYAVAEPLSGLKLKSLSFSERPTARSMIACLEKHLVRIRSG